eukprot:300092-Hanusia_phi.AAC.1
MSASSLITAMSTLAIRFGLIPNTSGSSAALCSTRLYSDQWYCNSSLLPTSPSNVISTRRRSPSCVRKEWRRVPLKHDLYMLPFSSVYSPASCDRALATTEWQRAAKWLRSSRRGINEVTCSTSAPSGSWRTDVTYTEL